jgi:hypothetical protein
VLRDSQELRNDPRLVSLRDELALTDVRLQERVKGEDWQGVEGLLELRRKLVATENRVEALRESTLSETQVMALVAGSLEVEGHPRHTDATLRGAKPKRRGTTRMSRTRQKARDYVLPVPGVASRANGTGL